MQDEKTTIQDLKKMVTDFTDERDWAQFHNPKNLSMAIAAEAAELMEPFLWVDNAASFDEYKKNKEDVEDELVDVLHAVLAFANACNIDVTTAFETKMVKRKAKYPVEKCKGKWTKYTKL